MSVESKVPVRSETHLKQCTTCDIQSGNPGKRILHAESAIQLVSRGFRGFCRRVSRVIAFALSWAGKPLALAGARSSIAASIYYGLVSSEFRREQRAVLAGRARYQGDQKSPREGFALLRRNIHRLEKGLLMIPRRPIFALDYIGETVDCFRRLVTDAKNAETSGSGEMRWAHDVLKAYFSATTRDKRTDRVRSLFDELSSQIKDGTDHALIPYKRRIDEVSPVSFDALLALSVRRRSVRWFLQKSVPRQLIEQAMEVAAQSPSACNRQPFEFRVVDDAELLAKVATVPMGTAGYAHNIPMFIVVVGQLANYFSERDRHLIYIDGALVAMSFALALETLGLSSCMINWPDMNGPEKAMAHLLDLKPWERPVLCLAVGYPNPDGLVACSMKKPVSRLVRYNHA